MIGGRPGDAVSERFYVRTSTGYVILDNGRRGPLACEVTVRDSAYCHRVIWSSLGKKHRRATREWVRKAELFAHRLNAGQMDARC